jgi:hypothetical protein
MSENPTSLLCRAATGAAVVVAALAMPAAAVAKKDHDKGKKKDAPAACADAKQSKHPHGGPPGLSKKADEMPDCKSHEDGGAPAEANANANAGAPVVNVTVVAPAPAPVSTVAASTSAGPCEKRGVFRITLHNGRVKTARVMLNGRAIPVTRTKRRTSVQLDMRGRKNKNFTMRHTVVTKSGRLKTGTRRFRTCG